MTTGTDMPPALPASDARFLSEMAQQLRVDSIRCSTAAAARELLKDWGMEAHDGY
jgi:hypothetical protein